VSLRRVAHNHRMSVQAPSAVVLIRPQHFAPNPATATDNAFQTKDAGGDPEQLAAAAHAEATGVADALAEAGVTVHLFENEDSTRPDSVFPNNWFSTHTGGRVALYPMYSPSRRSERRADVIEMLKRTYRVHDVVDYSGLEYDAMYLEGTGAMVIDHQDRVAYAARSNRANPVALERFCANFGYEPMVFDAFDTSGVPIYHTNVMMCIASDFVLIGLDMITDPVRRAEVRQSLELADREVIALDHTQIHDFLGNAIELKTPTGRVLALSSRAAASLTEAQRDRIEQWCTLLPLDVPTIELAGGSVRCMIAGIHLTPRHPLAAPTRTRRDRGEPTDQWFRAMEGEAVSPAGPVEPSLWRPSGSNGGLTP
jgi:hypothetical protein